MEVDLSLMKNEPRVGLCLGLCHLLTSYTVCIPSKKYIQITVYNHDVYIYIYVRL